MDFQTNMYVLNYRIISSAPKFLQSQQQNFPSKHGHEGWHNGWNFRWWEKFYYFGIGLSVKIQHSKCEETLATGIMDKAGNHKKRHLRKEFPFLFSWRGQYLPSSSVFFCSSVSSTVAVSASSSPVAAWSCVSSAETNIIVSSVKYLGSPLTCLTKTHFNQSYFSTGYFVETNIVVSLVKYLGSPLACLTKTHFKQSYFSTGYFVETNMLNNLRYKSWGY